MTYVREEIQYLHEFKKELSRPPEKEDTIYSEIDNRIVVLQDTLLSLEKTRNQYVAWGN